MTTGSYILPDSFKDLVDSCIAFIETNQREMQADKIRRNRHRLATFAEVFHKDCGTLTTSTRKKIKDLRDRAGIVVMTAHQPNLFAYSGVLRKATLGFALAKKLENRLDVPVVNFFGIADQDFTDDRWVGSCQLPAVQRSGGILSLKAHLPEKVVLNKVAKPRPDILRKWKTKIERWLADSVRSVNSLCKKLEFAELSSTVIAGSQRNLECFWSIVEDCYAQAQRYSDFNAFILSKIVNEQWGYDTVFSRFSECQQAFTEEFKFLLVHLEDYTRLLREVKQEPLDENMGRGVSDQEPELAPFWYHCDCGSKVRLSVTAKDELLFGEGSCVGCGKNHALAFGSQDNPDISDIAPLISARAIPMSLVFFKGLMPSCYIGGVGGIRYLIEAQHVALGLGIHFPPITVWRPQDRYLGVGQMEALLELRRICNDRGTPDLSTSRDSLQLDIREIRRSLDVLEASKKRIIEELRKHPNNREMKNEIMRIATEQTTIKKSLKLSVISHELKLLENVSTVFDLIPSITDYAVNVGLKETSDQWRRHLNENGNLSSAVRLESVLSRNEPCYESKLWSMAETYSLFG